MFLFQLPPVPGTGMTPMQWHHHMQQQQQGGQNQGIPIAPGPNPVRVIWDSIVRILIGGPVGTQGPPRRINPGQPVPPPNRQAQNDIAG